MERSRHGGIAHFKTPMPDVQVGIALGSNMGDRHAEMQAAINFLRKLAVDQRIRESPRFETESGRLRTRHRRLPEFRRGDQARFDSHHAAEPARRPAGIRNRTRPRAIPRAQLAAADRPRQSFTTAPLPSTRSTSKFPTRARTSANSSSSRSPTSAPTSSCPAKRKPCVISGPT